MADHSTTAAGHGTGHGHHPGDAHDPAHGDHPHVNLGTFVKVFFALLILTTISFAAYYFRDYIGPPEVSWAIMMAVSCAKALLVITFFMHLIWEASWKYVLTIPASLMSILLVLLLVPDIGRRTRTYSEERWRYASEPTAEQHAEQGEPRTAAASDDH